jgi:hypothetical protein
MLNLDNPNAQEARTGPLFVLFVRFLLLNPVVTRQVQTGKSNPISESHLAESFGSQGILREMPCEHHLGVVTLGCWSNPSGTRTMAEKYIGRPQNFVSSAL